VNKNDFTGGIADFTRPSRSNCGGRRIEHGSLRPCTTCWANSSRYAAQ